jgi:hypothetical protein
MSTQVNVATPSETDEEILAQAGDTSVAAEGSGRPFDAVYLVGYKAGYASGHRAGYDEGHFEGQLDKDDDDPIGPAPSNPAEAG